MIGRGEQLHLSFARGENGAPARGGADHPYAIGGPSLGSIMAWARPLVRATFSGTRWALAIGSIKSSCPKKLATNG